MSGASSASEAKRKRQPHPFQVGDKVRLNGKGPIGFPLAPDKDYIVSKTFYGNQREGDGPIPGHENTPGIMVKGDGGYFFAFRFDKVPPS